MWLISSNWDTIKFFSASANEILASSKRLLDWMTSKVVLSLPESYSSEIPSFAISAALSWALVASSMLFEDKYLDQKLEVSLKTLFLVSCKISWWRCLSKDDFLIAEIFSPPLIKGHVIVALIVSSSFSSILELKSLFSDLDTLIDAEGDNLAFSISRSFTDIS